jgi:hypothetical protein
MQIFRRWVSGERVIIGNKKETPVFFLHAQKILDSTKIIAKV